MDLGDGEINLQNVDLISKIVKNGKAIVFLGTGVSISTGKIENADEFEFLTSVKGGIQRKIKIHEVLSWHGLIWTAGRYLINERAMDGLGDIRSIVRKFDPTKIRRKKPIDPVTDMNHLLSDANKILKDLKHPSELFDKWLLKIFQNIKVGNPKLINAISDLKVPIATTNYDNLIEQVTGFGFITWKNTSRYEDWLEGNEKSIFHLHGHYKEEKSIIFDVTNYEAIINEKKLDAFKQVIYQRNVLIFVGYGQGLTDPHFKSLLDWGESHAFNRGASHYILVREGELEKTKKAYEKYSTIKPIAYGDDYDSLSVFFEEVSKKDRPRTPEPTTPEPTTPEPTTPRPTTPEPTTPRPSDKTMGKIRKIIARLIGPLIVVTLIIFTAFLLIHASLNKTILISKHCINESVLGSQGPKLFPCNLYSGRKSKIINFIDNQAEHEKIQDYVKSKDNTFSLEDWPLKNDSIIDGVMYLYSENAKIINESINDPTIKISEIGVSIPLTEKKKVIAEEETAELTEAGNGIMLGVAYAIFRQNNFLRGSSKKLRIFSRILNDHGDKTRAKLVAEQFANNTSILGVVGPYTSTSLAGTSGDFKNTALQVYKDNLPLVIPTATVPGFADGENIFRVVPTCDYEGRKIVDEVKLNRFSSIILLTKPGDLYSKKLSEATKLALKESKISYKEYNLDNYLISGEYLDNYIKKTNSITRYTYKEDSPENAVIIAGFADDVRKVAIKNSGKGLSFYAGNAAYRAGLLGKNREYSDAINGIKVITYFHQGMLSLGEESRKIVQNGFPQFIGGPPNANSAAGFDAAYILTQAIIDISSTSSQATRESIKEKLKQYSWKITEYAEKPYTGMMGDIAFEEKGEISMFKKDNRTPNRLIVALSVTRGGEIPKEENPSGISKYYAVFRPEDAKN